MIFDATPSSPNATSFVSVEYANAYNAAHPFGASWTGTDDEKKAFLMLATSMIDLGVEWLGAPNVFTQSLGLPRVGLPTRNGRYYERGVIPEEAMRATAELARLLKEEGALPSALTTAEKRGLKSFKAGPTAFEFDKDRKGANSFMDRYPTVYAFIRHLVVQTFGNRPTAVPTFRV